MSPKPRTLKYAETLRAVEERVVAALPEIIDALIARAKAGDLKAATYLADRIPGRTAGAAVDPAGARRLLDEACDRLRETAIAEGRSRTGGLTTVNGRTQAGAVSVAMAALLPTVERLEPDRFRERLWLTAAVIPPVSDGPNEDLTPWLVVAAIVSRYDRDMAASIIAPALARLPTKIADSNLYLSRESTSIRALTAYDPRAVVALLDALPNSARKPPAPESARNTPSLDAQVRLLAAEMLGLPVEQRFRSLLERDFQLQLFGQDR
jgi:hypothetical protein